MFFLIYATLSSLRSHTIATLDPGTEEKFLNKVWLDQYPNPIIPICIISESIIIYIYWYKTKLILLLYLLLFL